MTGEAGAAREALRARDVRLLDAVLKALTAGEADEELDRAEARGVDREGAFRWWEETERALRDMRHKLDGGSNQQVLTRKQREWAVTAAQRLDLDVDDEPLDASKVPKGKPVELLVGKNLPKAPPGRKPPSFPPPPPARTK